MLRRLLVLVPLAAGCGALRPAARQGHDLLDNPGRSAAIRFPAGIGALIGHAIALPITVVLYPTWFFEGAAVESCDTFTTAAPDASGADRARGDIYVPLVQAPLEYGSGLGAAVLAQPFEWIAGVFRDPPGPPPGQLVETPELPPCEVEAGASFDVHPPPKKG